MHYSGITLSAICVLLIFSMPGCGTENEKSSESLIGQAMAISKCGGFIESDSRVYSGDPGSMEDYCDAEVLHWSYNPESQTLSFLNSRVLLNCCGDHNIKIEQSDDGAYVLTETDMSVDGGGRCDCMCVFDFELTAQDVDAAEIQVTLLRDVEEQDDVKTIWQGAIDLRGNSPEISGSIVTSTQSADVWCAFK